MFLKKSLNTIYFISIFFIIILFSSMFTVREDEQAVILQFGKHVKTINSGDNNEAGFHFKIPFIQSVSIYEKRLLSLDPSDEEVILADQKRLLVDSFTRYRISNPLKFYQTVTTEDVAVSRLGDIVNSAVRDVLGKRKLQDLLSEDRIEIAEEIDRKVSEQASEMGIVIADVRVKKADLPKGAKTAESIYSKMRSNLEKEARKIRATGTEQAKKIEAEANLKSDVILSEAKKEAKIIMGSADKEAIEIWAREAKRDSRFFEFYHTLKAYETSLASSNKDIILNTDSDFLRFLKDK